MTDSASLPRWAKLDAGFLLRDTTSLLLGTFGPAGPLVFLAVILECEGSPSSRATDSVEVYFAPTARACGCTAADVKRIVDALGDLGKARVRSVPGGHSAVVTLLDRPKWAVEPRRVPGSRLRQHSHTPSPRTPTDQRIVAALSAGPLTRSALAEAVGVVPGGSLAERLKRLVESGQILKPRHGLYTLP